MKNILIIGGTGFIGSFLINRLKSSGYDITLSTRSPKNATEINWISLSEKEQIELVGKFYGIINLAGAGIADEKWSPERKEVLRKSRIETTASLAKSIVYADTKPEVFISASAVGYYGNSNSTEIDESAPKGKGFLADLSDEWEQAASPAQNFTRLVQPRIGVVLHPKAGALAKMILPFKMFVGGALGSGKQYMPWVHIDDIVAMFLFALEKKDLQGKVNFTAPNPVTMQEFASVLGNALSRPSIMPVPAIALKAMLGESAAMVLEGQRAVPRKLLDSGFDFKFPEIRAALVDLLK